MINLLRNKVACVPIFDSSDSGFKGYDGKDIKLLDQYKERVDQGIVKYVGAGVTEEKYGFKIGDLVIFSGYTGSLVNIEGEGLFIIMPARFVSCKIETEPTEVSGLFFAGEEATDNCKNCSYEEEYHTKNSFCNHCGNFEPKYESSYFPATYEKAMELIAKSFQEAPWRKDIRIKRDRPALEDYDEMEEDEDEDI